MTFHNLPGQCILAGTVILLIALAADRVLRRAPAAWRHFLWTVALAGLLVLPAAVRLTPKWEVTTTLPAAAMVQATAAPDMVVDVHAPKPERHPVLFGWLAGFSLAAAWFLAGYWRARGLVRRAQQAAYARPLMDEMGGGGVPVQESAAAPTAMAIGIWKPVVLLPAGAEQWPVERLRSALLHEWMHIRRRDLAAQAIAQAACCLYWFHPLVWLGAARLRRERETACDDAVLARGIAAQDYAEHLVELVRALRRRPSAAALMAEASGLEARVRALLDVRRDRRPLNRPAAFAMVTTLAALLLPVAAFTTRVHAAPPPQAAVAPAQSRGSLAGRVLDPSGARIPNCQIVAHNLDGANEEVAQSDPAGEFHFASIPAGRYSVEVRRPGFRIFKLPAVTVDPNTPATVNANLELGSVSEVVTVPGARPASTTLATPANPATRIRVGGMVQATKVLYRIPPVYPEALKAQGIAGTVRLAAIITKQGFLSDIRVVNDVNPELAAAAKEAVSHWLYQPSLLNGEPVAVLTTIDVVFELN